MKTRFALVASVALTVALTCSLYAAAPAPAPAPATKPATAPAITATTGEAAPIPADIAAKLKPIFDGKTLDGWMTQPRLLGGGNLTPALLEKLSTHSDPLAAFLYEHLDTAARDALATSALTPAVAPATSPDAASIKKAKGDLATALNAILTGPSIYEEARFAGVKLRDETKDLLAKNPAGTEIARLNRALLEDAWPEIVKPTALVEWTVKDGAISSVGVGRGTLYTAGDYSKYRIIFDVRHVGSEIKKDHQPCVLVFCTRPTPGTKILDALGGVQFQVPSGGHWDYRPGFNKGNNENFTNPVKPKFNNKEWARCEILVDATTGIARMAVASPIGTKAIEVLDFNDPAAGKPGPFALQMHNDGLYDEFKNIQVETDPTTDELVTTK